MSVAINGNYAIIGATQNDDGGTDSGSAYIFVRSGGTTWTQQQKLVASDGAAGDSFGQSVSIDGDYAIVGATRNDDAGSNSGSAYVFIRSGTTWTEQQKLVASDAAAEDSFGRVSISGDYVAVSARGDNNNTGSVYVFIRSGTMWTEQQKLIASDAATSDDFGNSVSIIGDYIVVGSPLNDDAGSTSGSSYIFRRFGTMWTEIQKLVASDAAISDHFGESVSISAGNVIVGANQQSVGNGSAYIFCNINIP